MNIKSKILLCILTFTFIIACAYEPYNQGKLLYGSHCENCHSADGSGLKDLIPDITNSTYLSSNKSKFSCIIRYGIQSKDSLLIMDMPPSQNLSSFEISNIINYVNHKWNKDFEEQTILQIESDLEACGNKDK